jgi:adenosylhomocysteinase
LIIDDGGDFTNLLHGEKKDLAKNLIGGCEETTTGIHRLKSLHKSGKLRFPMINVNDADCKHLFDNRYGTGQSTLDGIMHTTNLIIAGQTVVVAGYGWCGRGIAMRAKGMGAIVIVTEIDNIKAIEARMDGFSVMPMLEAAKLGDLFITVTGCCEVISKKHFKLMKDGAVLCNSGHFDVEIDKKGLEELALEVIQRKENITGYKMPNGKMLNLLAEGRLVNLAAGNGHPAEIMDMSFALQAKSLEYLAGFKKQDARLAPGLYNVPEEIDQKTAALKLASMGSKIDALTPSQKKYME